MFLLDLAEFFDVTNEGSAVSLQLLPGLPAAITGNVLILTLEARRLTDIAYATIVLHLTGADTETLAPVFEEPYYLGSYSETDGLNFDHSIRLIDDFDASVVFSLEGGNFELIAFDLMNINVTAGEEANSLRHLLQRR